MKKLFILNIILLSLSNIALGQFELYPNMEKDRENIINNSTYIFEGIPLTLETYKVGEETYGSYIIQIKKVIRGNIKIGTIELIVGPGNGSSYDRGPNLYQYKTHIFFCLASNFPANPKPPLKDNPIPVIVYPSYLGSLINIFDSDLDEYKAVGLGGGRFKLKEDFYNYLKKFSGVTIPPDEPIVQKAQTALPVLPYTGVDSVERERRFRIQLEQIKASEDSFMIFAPGQKSFYEQLQNK